MSIEDDLDKIRDEQRELLRELKDSQEKVQIHFKNKDRIIDWYGFNVPAIGTVITIEENMYQVMQHEWVIPTESWEVRTVEVYVEVVGGLASCRYDRLY